jgi:hypothetical protein
MWDFLQLLFRCAEALIGVFCFLTAIGLYPGEEGKVQSKLEDFWIRLDDNQKSYVSRHTAFLVQTVRFESSLLDYTFGPRMLSVRAFVVSMSFSFIMMAMMLFAIILFIKEGNPSITSQMTMKQADLPKFFLEGLATLLIALAAIFVEVRLANRTKIIAVSRCVLLLLVFAPAILKAHHQSWYVFGRGLALFLTLMLLSFFGDLIFVIVTRRMLAWAGKLNSILTVLSLLLLNLLLAFLFVVPVALVPYLDTDNRIGFALGAFLIFIPFANIFDIILSLLWVLLALILLIHRLLWPVLNRTLFRVTGIGTIPRRIILVACGMALLNVSFFHERIPELFKELVKVLAG